MYIIYQHICVVSSVDYMFQTCNISYITPQSIDICSVRFEKWKQSIFHHSYYIKITPNIVDDLIASCCRTYVR